jgi:hypothetical protein
MAFFTFIYIEGVRRNDYEGYGYDATHTAAPVTFSMTLTRPSEWTRRWAI